MLTVVARVLDPMFARPRGVLGQLGGRIMARTNLDVERRVVELAAPTAGETVLVIGPGPGVGMRMAAQACPGGRVIGVEPSPVMRAQAAARCVDLMSAGRVEVRDGHAAATGLADGSAHVAISVNNVMFWPDRDAGFAELHRVLRADGRLVLCSHEMGLKVAEIGLDTLRAEVERAGFVDVKLDTREHASVMGTAIELLARRG
jgi:arsenite methyltransferase